MHGLTLNVRFGAEAAVGVIDCFRPGAAICFLHSR